MHNLFVRQLTPVIQVKRRSTKIVRGNNSYEATFVCALTANLLCSFSRSGEIVINCSENCPSVQFMKPHKWKKVIYGVYLV